MTRNDIRILDTLHQKQCVNQIQALTIRKICEHVNLSEAKVRSTIKGLMVGKLVSNGLSNGNATTYYITPQGISFLEDVKSIC